MNEISEQLLQQLDLATEPQERARLYNELSASITMENPPLGLEYAVKALELAESIQDKNLIGLSLKNTGVAHIVISNVEESYTAFTTALDIFKDLGDRVAEAGMMDNIASLYGVMSRYDESIEMFFQCLQIAEELQNKRLIAKICNNIGTTYKQINNYPKAVEYLTKGLLIREQMADMEPNEILYINIGNLHQDLGHFDKAMEYYSRALEYSLKTSSQRGQAYVLGNIGATYSLMGEYAQARENLERAIELHQSLHDRISHSRDLMNLGELSQREGKHEEAVRHFLKGLNVSVEADKRRRAILLNRIADSSIELSRIDEAYVAAAEALEITKVLKLNAEQCRAHQLLAVIFEKKEDFKSASEHYKQYVHIQNESQLFEKERITSELHAKYQMEKTEREKELLKKQNFELSTLLKEVELLNEQLLHADNDKNDLLGIIAHDLKNPLSGIRLMARFLKNSYTDHADIVEIGEDIETNSQRMFELIEDLLRANRIESENFRLALENYSPEPLIENILSHYQLAAAEKNILIRTQFSDGENLISIDRSALLQILDNLVSNAIKFSPKGKTILVTTVQLSDVVRVTIQDEGPGLTSEDKSRLFQKFARLSAQTTGGEHSTGLGLYIVKKLTESMNGRISCQSEPGHGAAFILEFPCIKEPVEV